MNIETLNEGVIKVPENTLNEVMALVCSDVFSRIFNYLHLKDMHKNFPELEHVFKDAAKKYKEKYGKFEIYDNVVGNFVSSDKVHIHMKDVDPRYIKNPDNKTKNYTLNIAIGHSNSVYPSANYIIKAPGRPARMAIKLPKEEFLAGVIRAPEFLGTMMERLYGMIKHELMHTIQNMGLNTLSAKSLNYYDKDNNLNWEAYFTSDIEFGPQIVSGVHELKAIIKDFKNLRYRMTPELERSILLKYVNPTSPAVDLGEGKWNFDSAFFDMLYKKDKQKWKKAVKYFYDLYQKIKE